MIRLGIVRPFRQARFQFWTLIVTGLVILVGVFVTLKVRKTGVPHLSPAITVEGSVLKEDVDPSKRTPLPGVTVRAERGETEVTAQSDPTGYFSVRLEAAIESGATLTLSFEKAGYRRVEMVPTQPGDQLYIVQMQLLEKKPELTLARGEPPAKTVTIKDVRVRYSFKDQSTISVGTVAKEFVATNKGNVPCRDQKPCSPDGRWKATLTVLPLDAERGNEFRNVRVSCVAGPCHFVKVETNATEKPTARVTVSVLNWSDPTAFLLESDVIRTMATDNVRQAYPFILGDTMSFALPPNSQGLSIEANLDGKLIIFPVGPALKLSWADCSEDTSPDGSRTFRCQLKPGYGF